MRTPLALIFIAGQSESLCHPPSLASTISAQCKYNLVCGSSKKTLSMHAQSRTSLHTRSNAGCGWGLAPGPVSLLEIKDVKRKRPCAGRSQESCCWVSINAVGNWFCWACRTDCAARNVMHTFFQDPVQVETDSPSPIFKTECQSWVQCAGTGYCWV